MARLSVRIGLGETEPDSTVLQTQRPVIQTKSVKRATKWTAVRGATQEHSLPDGRCVTLHHASTKHHMYHKQLQSHT